MFFADLRVLNEHQQIQSFSAFNSIYNNTGIFGIHATTVSHYFICQLFSWHCCPLMTSSRLICRCGHLVFILICLFSICYCASMNKQKFKCFIVILRCYVEFINNICSVVNIGYDFIVNKIEHFPLLKHILHNTLWNNIWYWLWWSNRYVHEMKNS